ERTLQRGRRRLALGQVLLEPLRPLLVMLTADVLGLVDAEPLEHFGKIVLELLRRIRIAGVACEFVEPQVPSLMHEGRGIRVLEQVDNGLVVAQRDASARAALALLEQRKALLGRGLAQVVGDGQGVDGCCHIPLCFLKCGAGLAARPIWLRSGSIIETDLIAFIRGYDRGWLSFRFADDIPLPYLRAEPLAQLAGDVDEHLVVEAGHALAADLEIISGQAAHALLESTR